MAAQPSYQQATTPPARKASEAVDVRWRATVTVPSRTAMGCQRRWRVAAI
jgi:hypothetical protein